MGDPLGIPHDLGSHLENSHVTRILDSRLGCGERSQGMGDGRYDQCVCIYIYIYLYYTYVWILHIHICVYICIIIVYIYI